MEYLTPEEMFELVHGRRTDDPEWFRFGDTVADPVDVVSILSTRMSDARKDTIERVLACRTDT